MDKIVPSSIRERKYGKSKSVADSSTYENFTKIFGKFTKLLMLMTVMV